MSAQMYTERGDRTATGDSSDAAATARAPDPSRSGALADREMIAVAEASRRLVDLARRVALSDCTVLIAGESGTGKEVLARFIHRHSPRASQPFVAVNCAAIPENMLEAILFGYERGAFTGAHAAHPGKFEQAQGGTLLLDEITEMPLGLQAKLLRVLQEREVERLGGRVPIPLDVRVLATTNRDLRAEVDAQRFREDLYYRLNVFPLPTLPLRDRRDDVLPLAMNLLTARCRPGERIPALTADAAHLLLTYPWPGNVRELDNVMQRSLILANGALVDKEHIHLEKVNGGQPLERIPASRAIRTVPVQQRTVNSDSSSSSPSLAAGGQGGGALQPPASNHMSASSERALASSLCATEHELILEALRTDNGNREAVAKRLGISPRTLRYKLARMRDAGVIV